MIYKKSEKKILKTNPGTPELTREDFRNSHESAQTMNTELPIFDGRDR